MNCLWGFHRNPIWAYFIVPIWYRGWDVEIDFICITFSSYISQLIRFARVSGYVSDFNTRNLNSESSRTRLSVSQTR